MVVGELVGWDEVVDVEVVGDCVVVGWIGVVVDFEGDFVDVVLVCFGVVFIFGDGDCGGGVVGDFVWFGVDWYFFLFFVGWIFEEGIW